MRILLCLFTACIFSPLFSQKNNFGKLPSAGSTLKNIGRFTTMPYNRLIQSAGKVITFGDSSLENHAMDLCVVPGKNLIAVEDRYGIAIINTTNNNIEDRWSFTAHSEWNGIVSTYSGITSFIYNNKLFFAWSASGSNNKSFIMIASWEGRRITDVSGIAIEPLAPANLAIPNQVVANIEDGTLFLYAVLNGNNRLLKIRFDDRKIIWSAQTGIAPFGLCIIDHKAYVTNWAGPLVTDTTLESAGTPWGNAYTNSVTGGTSRGALSII